MALNRLTCPECSAGIESSAGYSPGQVVRCPKCETEFTVEDGGGASGSGQPAARRAGEGDDFPLSAGRASASSYKNSWMRYAVLGVLLAVLGVLGYMLYQKRVNEGKDTAIANGDDDSVKSIEPRIVGPAPQLKMVQMAAGGVPTNPKAKDKVERKKSNLSPEEIKNKLAGRWATKYNGEPHSVVYKADGTFLYKVEKEGMAAKTIPGKWKVIDAEEGPSNPAFTITILNTEWTAEGKPAFVDRIMLRSDGLAGHPLIDQQIEGKKSVATFSKKE